MTNSQLARFENILKTILAELENGGRVGNHQANRISSDVLNHIQSLPEHVLALGIPDHKSYLLGMVRCSLAQIEARTFGRCHDCDEEISAKRLAAVPWASLCIMCQDFADRRDDQDLTTSGESQATAHEGQDDLPS